MTFSQIIAEARRITKANSSSFPTDDIVTSANNALERVVSLIREAQGRWQWDDSNNTDLPVSTTNLVANQGDYTMDPSQFEIDKIEAMDVNGGWRTLIPFDVSDPRCASYSSLAGGTGEPIFYDKQGDSLILVPKPATSRSSALKVYYERGPNYFNSADTLKTPGFNPLFHKLIPLWCAYDYAIINQLPVAQQLGTPSKDGRTLGVIPTLEAQLVDFYALRGRDEHIRLTSGTRNQSFR